jgi:hypothetical protein
MVKLRDGSEVADARLARLVQFDEMSRQFPIRATVGTKKPRSYTWRCHQYLDQGQEGACFPADTFVRMADGSQKRIQQIALLEEVVTAEGNVGRVMQTMARPYEGELTGVRLRGHHAVFCTPEHPFLTGRGYVAARDLTADDYVAVTRYLPDPTGDLDLRGLRARRFRGKTSGPVNTGGAVSHATEVPLSVAFDFRLGRILGLYAAEGHTTENKVVWTFGKHEKDTLVPELLSLLREALSIEARVQPRPNETQNVIVYGKPWRVLFSLLVPGTSKHGDKRLSPHVTAGSPEFLEGVLEGWLDGDGHRRRTSVEGITVCHQLALDMHAIANGLGRRPTSNLSAPSMNEHAQTRQDRWSITLPTGEGQNLMRQTDEAVWRKVTEIERKPFCGMVFNIHVEGDESYVAEGLGVHNCVGFSMAHELAARPAEVQGLDAKFAREQVYWEAQKIDEWAGGAYPGASPFYEGTSVLAGVKVLKKLGYIDEYRWAFGLDDLVMAVGYAGPAVLGIPWYEGMFDMWSCGNVHVHGQVAGGHAILCKGVDVKEQTFTLHNSWGPVWGRGGDAKIAWSDMDRLLHEQGEAVIPMGRHRSLLSRLFGR